VRVTKGFLRNKGTREIWQWEHGNKAKKSQGTREYQIVQGTGNTKNYKALGFLHKRGGDRRFSSAV